jgi:hypothetical protein
MNQFHLPNGIRQAGGAEMVAGAIPVESPVVFACPVGQMSSIGPAEGARASNRNLPGTVRNR